MIKIHWAWLLLVIHVPHSVIAQDNASSINAQYQTDWTSPQRLTDALYGTVSGPAHAARDWQRYRLLFHPTARLYNVDSSSGTLVVQTLNVEDYIDQLGPFFKTRGIWESEATHITERYAHIAHRWSTCEYRWDQPSAPPSGRCIASITFVNDGARWWIMGMTWESENGEYPIPGRYLPE